MTTQAPDPTSLATIASLREQARLHPRRVYGEAVRAFNRGEREQAGFLSRAALGMALTGRMRLRFTPTELALLVLMGGAPEHLSRPEGR